MSDDIKPGVILVRRDSRWAIIVLTVSEKLINNRQFIHIKYLGSKGQISSTSFVEPDLDKFFIVASPVPTCYSGI